MTRSPLSSSFLLPGLPNLVKGVNGKSKERVIRKLGVGFMGCLNGGVKVIQRQDPKAQRCGQAFDPCPTEAADSPSCGPKEAAVSYRCRSKYRDDSLLSPSLTQNDQPLGDLLAVTFEIYTIFPVWRLALQRSRKIIRMFRT